MFTSISINSLKRLLKHSFLCILFVSVGTTLSFARGAQDLVASGSWVYDALTAVTLDSGTASLLDNAPLTVAEIKAYLSHVPYDSLSRNAKLQFDRINAYFDEKGWSADCGIVSLGTEPVFSLEGYYQSNADNDWIYDRYQKKPLIELPITLTVGDVISMYSGIHLAINKQTMIANDNYCNIPLGATQTDINFPTDTSFSTGHLFTEDTGITFQIGTNPREVGRTLTGSCIMSDTLTGATYGQLSLFSPNIKWTSEAVQLNVDRYYYSHRIDLRFFKKVTFSVLEGTLTYAPLELRYLNPFTIFHGFTPWRDYGSNDSHNCEIMAFKAEYVPVKYLRIYGLFVQDQWQTLYERTNWPNDETPNGLGGQLGTEAYLPANDGYLHVALEGYYADPYLYIKQSPNWSYVRTYSENIGNDDYAFYEWVGSPFGPDTVAGEFTVGYEIPDAWSVDLTYLFMARGQYADRSIFTNCGWGGTDLDSDDTKWIYPKDASTRDYVTPSGENPEYVNRISIRGTWHATNALSLMLQPGYVYTYNSGHVAGKIAQGFEVALSVSCKLDALWNFSWNMGEKPVISKHE